MKNKIKTENKLSKDIVGKNILVPVDYSSISDNALEYAIELAKFLDTGVVLFHAYQIPVPASDVPVVISPLDLEEMNEKKMKLFSRRVIKKYSDKVRIESKVCAGFAVDEIVGLAKEIKSSLIVMGVNGASKIGEAIFGSNTTAVIKRTKIPVLVIPPKSKFKKIKKIALAYDYEREVDKHVMQKINEFVKMFNGELLVTDVIGAEELVTAHQKSKIGAKLESSLAEVKHSYYLPFGENVVNEINSFVDEQKADWLVMIPHHHKFFQEPFHASNTKRMAFHTHVPLLSIHD
ncbi:MAG TPA: universal stress protein [Bacteroidia bacterium]